MSLTALAAGCTSSGEATSATGPADQPRSATASADLSKPVGVIAIGHSGLTGEGTAGPLQAAPQNSWATGTNPNVNSIYSRLVKRRPETAGHVANTATGGAPSAALPDQADTALAQVPAPALVIIQTIDNDIRCDGTDKQHVPEFGRDVQTTLENITAASPNSKIIMVGQAGRPSPAFVRRLVARDPSTKSGFTGDGVCDFYDPSGKLRPGSFHALTAIIDAYEAEQARICAHYPQCETDGGVRAAYKDKLANFSPDWNHFNIRGQAAQAELMWPVVAKQFATR